MNIIMQTIPHNEQRYKTVGDWRELPDGTIIIEVSDMGNEDYHVLVAVHELVEFLLCKKRGITDEEVTKFDKAYEAQREPGDTSEPGFDPNCPYYEEHKFASFMERNLAAQLDVYWQDYERAVNSL